MLTSSPCPLSHHGPTDYHTSQSTRISLTWKEGVEATDWEQVAKRDNLDVVQTELLRLEEAVHTIHLELQQIRRKEEEMRDVNGEPAPCAGWISSRCWRALGRMLGRWRCQDRPLLLFLIIAFFCNVLIIAFCCFCRDHKRAGCVL